MSNEGFFLIDQNWGGDVLIDFLNEPKIPKG